MNEPLTVWARVFLRLGLVLLAVGYAPLALTAYVLTTWDQLVPVLLAFTVGPIGVLAMIVALILFLAALLKRKRGPS
jgi:hypothetical protein